MLRKQECKKPGLSGPLCIQLILSEQLLHSRYISKSRSCKEQHIVPAWVELTLQNEEIGMNRIHKSDGERSYGEK